ncbi:unnamed protein product [Phytomonas sp. EM1]|nr:unnamed protein product [Phytomonas sp. EM1]|eukprot:CCW62392.1 unnamed protein product [Phytomonas sp. isolate EM1]
MLAALYYKQKESQQNGKEKGANSIISCVLEDREIVEKTNGPGESLRTSIESKQSSQNGHPPASCSRTQTLTNSHHDDTEQISNRFEIDDVLKGNEFPEKVTKTAKILRFSNRKSLDNSNSIRNALNETIGGKYTSLSRLNTEFLQAKRIAFLETLFDSNDTVQILPRFNLEKSGQSLSSGVADMFGGNYSDAIGELQKIWNRLK